MKYLTINLSIFLLARAGTPRQTMRTLVTPMTRKTSRLSSSFIQLLQCIGFKPLSSDIASLKRGFIKTSKDKAIAPYTILLVGETGVGKSSVLEYIANVLIGRDADDYDFEILDHTNEQGGSDNQSQTNSARLYELKSNNGLTVCASVSGD